ncbi:CinA family protein [Pedobacter agri]|uniref:CinA family protein n=1 Tax=Pedobacter agri TaxID=454586 RepID=UPI00293077E7|nr:CinA family protein [Pedobacter agri]
MSKNLNKIGRLLIEKKLSIAFAESATGGRLSTDFAMIENAGTFLKGGIVCYDASVKEDLLKVDHELIETFTPESFEVTRAITKGASQMIPADIHIGVTGLTCPGGSETKEKPVGTMFLYGQRGSTTIFSERFRFTGSKKQIVESTVDACGKLLLSYLQKLDKMSSRNHSNIK